MFLEQCPGGISGRDPNVPKTTRLHVDIFRFFIEEYSVNTSKFIGNFPEVFNSNRLFLKLNRFTFN